MSVLYTNNATTTLASGISDSATSITVASGTGALFPTISGSDYFNVTLTDSSKHIEIVKVTARSGDVLTVTRAQEGTSARAWLASDILELRLTKNTLDQIKIDAVSGYAQLDSDVTFDSVQFNGGTGDQGTVSWNTDEETLDLIQNGATLQLGQELQTHCRNNTTSSIANATVVMATGTLGTSGRITIAPWDGATDVKFIVGITTEVIAAGTDGKVTTFGKVRDVDTSLITGTFTNGVIYARRDGTGGLTYTKPDAKAVPLAFLIANETSGPANNGTIMVRVTPVDEITLEHAETAYGWGNHASAGYASASTLSSHISNTSNPHSVTATQVGLGNVTNESKATMFTSPTFTGNAVLGSPASGNFSTGTFTWPTFNQNTSGNAATATSAGNADTLDGYHASSFQATLVSGTNIKTVGGTSLLGSGDVAVSAFPSGTAMLFAQTAAPTGWTKSTAHDNKALRVVSGTAGSGGSTAFTSVFASRTPSGSVSSISGTVGATTLSTAQMPSHDHILGFSANPGVPGRYGIVNSGVSTPETLITYTDSSAYGNLVSSSGGGNSHTHSFSGSGSLSMNAMDFAVQYVDVIIATKN